LVESAVGSSLANGIAAQNIELFYWSGRNREVDFVLSRKNELIAIEVKSGRNKGSFPGIEAFSKEFKVKRKLLVGSQGISLDEFFMTPPEELF
jgi:predicted AAA+ superfamily ATPase